MSSIDYPLLATTKLQSHKSPSPFADTFSLRRAATSFKLSFISIYTVADLRYVAGLGFGPEADFG